MEVWERCPICKKMFCRNDFSFCQNCKDMQPMEVEDAETQGQDGSTSEEILPGSG